MYTGLELAIIIYVVGFIIHMGLFRCFLRFYSFAEDFVNPTVWCFIWPIAWIVPGLWYGVKVPLLIYYAVEYVITGQWNN